MPPRLHACIFVQLICVYSFNGDRMLKWRKHCV